MDLNIGTKEIETRMKVFDERFAALTARYDEFAKTLEMMNQRIEEHLIAGEEALKVARDEQEEAVKPKGIKKWFAKRNQGRINAKIMGAIERDFAILRDVQVQNQRNLQLISDTGVAVQRDLHEMMESVVTNLQSFQSGTAQTIRLLAEDLELLKQLSAKQALGDSGVDVEKQE